MNKRRPSLTTRQRQAIDALLSAPSIRAASQASGIPLRTLHRWLSEEAFRAELDYLQRQAIDLSLTRLANMVGEALTVTRHAMLTPDASPATRLRAAEIILGKLLPLKDMEMEHRLDAIEQIIKDYRLEENNVFTLPN